jgi:hypothetical protein
MQPKVKRSSSEKALMRVLDALAQEIIEASDDEVMRAAADLRMDPSRRDSAAFAGLTYFARPQLSDFFDIEGSRRLQAPTKRPAVDPPVEPSHRQRRSKRLRTTADKKLPSGK